MGYLTQLYLQPFLRSVCEKRVVNYSLVFQDAVAGNVHIKVNSLEMKMGKNRQAQGHHQIFTGIHPVCYFMSQRILCPCLQCTHIIPTHAVKEGCDTFLCIFKLASNFQILWEAGPLKLFGQCQTSNEGESVLFSNKNKYRFIYLFLFLGLEKTRDICLSLHLIIDIAVHFGKKKKLQERLKCSLWYFRKEPKVLNTNSHHSFPETLKNMYVIQHKPWNALSCTLLRPSAL